MPRVLSPDFVDRTLELEGSVRARLSSRETAWALRSAAHVGDDAFSALARRITSSPARLAGVLSGEHDPLLLCALAGRRCMQDLAGVVPADGRSAAPAALLELLAARAVRRHWELCCTDPVRAQRLEARWMAGRATMRSGYLGAPLAAMEATYGAACSAEREAAQGRLVSVVPPAAWTPGGVHAGALAGYGSPRWDRMRSQAVAETEPPEDWRCRPGNDAAERPRARFVARGAGRTEQLARRWVSPRMAVSRVAFQVRLKRAMARGPAATRRFLVSLASNPRRAAAAVRARLDPMVVAAAIGPSAIEGALAGRLVRTSGPLGRLQDELYRRDLARLEQVRAPARVDRTEDRARLAADPEVRAALDGGVASRKGMRDASARFVDAVWCGDRRDVEAGAGWRADSALGEQFEQGHVAGSVYDAWRARREAVVQGEGAAELGRRYGAQRWSRVASVPVDATEARSAAEARLRERFDELGGAEAGYRLRRDVVVPADPAAGVGQVDALVIERQDLLAVRGAAAGNRTGAGEEWWQGDAERLPGVAAPAGGQMVPPVPALSASETRRRADAVGPTPLEQSSLTAADPPPVVPGSKPRSDESADLGQDDLGGDEARGRSQAPPPPDRAAQVPAVSVVVPADALRDVEIEEEDLPKMVQEAAPPPNGSWKVCDDELVERVVPLADGSYEVRFKPGVVAASQACAEQVASQTHKRRTDPELVEQQNERTVRTLELERAARETFADAVERGRAPFDVERGGLAPGEATDAFTREPVEGFDGDLLRAKAIREGCPHDLRFATREQIEAAGGCVRGGEDGREVDGVVVMREVAVSAQPFGRDGKLDPAADPVEYRVKAPVVLYHVATATDLDRAQVPRQRIEPPVPEMTAEDLCESVGVRTVSTGHRGISEFQPKAARLDVPTDTIAIRRRCRRVGGRAQRAPGGRRRPRHDVVQSGGGGPSSFASAEGDIFAGGGQAPVRAAPGRGSRGGSRRGAYRRGVSHLASGHRGRAGEVRPDPRESVGARADRAGGRPGELVGGRRRAGAVACPRHGDRAGAGARRPGGRRGPRADGSAAGAAGARALSAAPSAGGGCRHEQHVAEDGGGGPDGRGAGVRSGRARRLQRDRVRRAVVVVSRERHVVLEASRPLLHVPRRGVERRLGRGDLVPHRGG